MNNEELIAKLDYEALGSRYPNPHYTREIINGQLEIDGVARYAFYEASDLLKNNGVHHRFTIHIKAPHDIENDIRISDKTQDVVFEVYKGDPSVTYRLQFAAIDRELDDYYRFSALELTANAEGRLTSSLHVLSRNKTSFSIDGGFNGIYELEGWRENPGGVVDHVMERVHKHILQPRLEYFNIVGNK